MQLGFKSIWRKRFNISLVLTLLWSAQVVHAQIEEGSSEIEEPLDYYIVICAPKDRTYAEVFYSASPKDIYRINRNLGSTFFKAQEVINTADGGRFLRGYFYNVDKTTTDKYRREDRLRAFWFAKTTGAMGLPIPKGRTDEYRRKDGLRAIWFVRSSQWLCFSGFENMEWINQYSRDIHRK